MSTEQTKRDSVNRRIGAIKQMQEISIFSYALYAEPTKALRKLKHHEGVAEHLQENEMFDQLTIKLADRLTSLIREGKTLNEAAEITIREGFLSRLELLGD